MSEERKQILKELAEETQKLGLYDSPHVHEDSIGTITLTKKDIEALKEVILSVTSLENQKEVSERQFNDRQEREEFLKKLATIFS